MNNLNFAALPWVLAWALTGCGGGGGSSAGPPVRQPSPPDTHRYPYPPPPPRPTSLPLHIEGLYLTQGSQRLDRSVPLVQNRQGCLRVFVLADRWSGPAPPVRVQILDRTGVPVLDQEIPGPGTGVPSVLRETDLTGSWNLMVDGACIQPGSTLTAQVEAPPGVPAGNLNYPAEGGALALDVVPVAPLRITLVPIRCREGLGRVLAAPGHGTLPARTKESWVENLELNFPLDRIEVEVAARPFDTTLDPQDEAQQSQLLNQLEMKRLEDRQEYVYYYGVYPARGGGVRNRTGRGFQPAFPGPSNRSALGWDAENAGYGYQEALTHELGHNLGLGHAPCGSDQFPKLLDPDFPYPDGGIGACGFNLKTRTPVDPAVTKDHMSYCRPAWASDYDCRRILAFRKDEPMAPPRTAHAEDQDGLLVGGVIRQGRAELNPAFQAHRPPLAVRAGEYRLEALDEAGQVLAEQAFTPAAEEDGDEAEAFVLFLPLDPHRQASLAALRVTRVGAVLGELRPAPHGRGITGFHPRALRGPHGLARLTWDARAYPEVMVKDPHTGEVVAMGRGGRLELDAPGPSLEAHFSDGLRTVVVTVPVL